MFHNERLGDGGEGVKLDPAHCNEESLSYAGKDSIRRLEEYGWYREGTRTSGTAITGKNKGALHKSRTQSQGKRNLLPSSTDYPSPLQCTTRYRLDHYTQGKPQSCTVSHGQ